MKEKHSFIKSGTSAHIAVCLVLVLSIAFLYFYHLCNYAWICVNIETGIGSVEELYKSGNDILTKRNRLQNLARANGLSDAAVMLCFDSSGEGLYDRTYPLVKSYGFKGAFVLRDGAVPGDSGVMTVAQCSALLADGWEIVLGGTGGADLSSDSGATAFGRYLDSFGARLAAAGIAMPAVYYSDADCSAACFDVLERHGIKVVIRNAAYTSDKRLYSGGWDGKLYICGSNTIQNNASDIQLSVFNASQSGGSVVIMTRNVTDTGADNALDCSVTKYKTCLEWLKSYGSYYGFVMSGFAGMHEDKLAAAELLRVELDGAGTVDEQLETLNALLWENTLEICRSMESSYAPVADGFGLDDLFDFCSSYSIPELIQVLGKYDRIRRESSHESDITYSDYYYNSMVEPVN